MSHQSSLFPLFEAPQSGKTLRSLELFAGAGGLGLGLQQANFQHGIVVDWDRTACDTLRFNKANGYAPVKDWEIVEADVANVDLSAVRGELDLLAGSPDCRPWSIGGRNMGQDDHRDTWPWAINATRVTQPRGFLFENVRNMATKHADQLEYVKRQLSFPEITIRDGESQQDHNKRLMAYARDGLKDGLCYRVWSVISDAADFGTGQHRFRVYVIGLRRDVTANWTAPEATHSQAALDRDKWLLGSYWERHGIKIGKATEAEMRRIRSNNRKPPADVHLKPYSTLRDAIADLGEPTLAGHRSIANHEAPPREARAYDGHTGSPIDSPAKALRAGCHGVSGGENMIDFGDGTYRHFTVREAARLQDIPDEYVIQGTWSDGLKQLGNAVSVNQSRAMGQSVHAALTH